MDTLNFYESLHLVKMEETKQDALDLIAKLWDQGQIKDETKTKLQGYVAQTMA